MNRHSLNNLTNMLLSLLGNEDLVVKWWYSPNNHFDKQCPADVDLSKVIEYLERHCYG